MSKSRVWGGPCDLRKVAGHDDIAPAFRMQAPSPGPGRDAMQFKPIDIDPVGDARQAYIDALVILADAEGPADAWHSIRSPVYHTSRLCTEGNNIEPWNCRPGSGGRRLCGRCAELGG